MEENMKIVKFENCKKCKHFEKDEYEDPCYECLLNPVNYASEKPVYFEEREKKKGN